MRRAARLPSHASARREPVDDDEADFRPRQGWTLKRDGKVAPGTDVHRRALIYRADMLHRLGAGGGIVSLLLPKTDEEHKRLERDRAIYSLRRARLRCKGERGQTRELSMLQSFLAAALALKGDRLNPAWKVKHFLQWVVDELEDRTSPLHRLAQAHFSLLLGQERRLRWWQNRVTELRKMSR